MKSNILTLRKSLNKAFLKVKPYRPEFEAFKENLLKFTDQINESESEEFHKNVLSGFLKDTWYSPDHYINTKDRYDLVIHTGKNTESPVGVLFETKRPGDKTEMPSEDNLNTKAFHELLLYWLRERITGNNLEIKYLIATDMYDWFIFNAGEFEKLFAGNKQLVKQFRDFEEGRLSGKTTDFFYRSIAEPFIRQCDQEISHTHIDLRDYEKSLREGAGEEENKLIALYKVFSPEHLLKLPFTNDSNTLDKRFYNELLHIIGLKETKEGSKKLIGRKPEGERNTGSLIENAVNILQYDDCLSQVKASGYGNNKNEQLYHIALELVITWINRILFLKLLEGQLVRYNRGDENFRFLNAKRIPDYDTLNKLFFQVLAMKEDGRGEPVRQNFRNVPYLNSSLFEPGELEHKTIRISNLDDEPDIPLLSATVLKDNTGKRISGRMNTLHYLFAFLDAYDFSGEGSVEIQEESKTLINASVLGLIFEKINGYKDGSFFTPGFITMYMCRETIRRAVVQKFNDAKGWNCETIPDVFNKINDEKEANRIINSLKICDPAVGSGHFLVSALNEIIAIKSELKILLDREGRRLKYYHVEVANDELVITDEDGELFEYNPASKESQRIQEALFHEKQALIENCLFGVDINPNSVKICRLRLWIELLKSAYYKTPERDSQGLTLSQALTDQPHKLETLPNIDINIKCGNSLISRYPLDADIRKALRDSRWSVDSYRVAVMTYRNAQSKEVKREMEEMIAQIKNDFESEVVANDKRIIRLKKLKGELITLTTQTSMFEKTKAEKLRWEREVKKLTDAMQKLETELAEIRTNKIYENAFEWRFEFPEVLNDDGDFVGFDVVIGNPPYFSLSKIKKYASIYEQLGYQTYSKGIDIYCLFYERGNQILKRNGILTYISSNSWLRAIYGDLLKKYFRKQMQPLSLLNIEDIQIFEEATVESNIITLQKEALSKSFQVCNLGEDYLHGSSLEEYFKANRFDFTVPDTSEWIISNQESAQLKKKIEKSSTLLKDFNVTINRGILTGYNAAFIIDENKMNELIKADSKNHAIIKPILRGRDLKKYSYRFSGSWAICTFPSLNVDIEQFPAIKNYFLSIGKERLNQSGNKGSRKKTNNKWFETQDSISYWKDFKKPKIVWGEIADKPKFAFDDNNYYAEATTFLMTGEKLKYLLAILNSKVSEWYFNQISTTTGMGTNRWKKYKIELLPIKIPSGIQEKQIENLVEQILTTKKSDPYADTSALEAEIDQLVYKLYGLTSEEIRIVEEAVG